MELGLSVARPDSERTRTMTASITKRSTMQEVLKAYPSAERALFSRYHIGGCNSCGYEPGDILENVANSHNINDLDEVIAYIEQSEQADRHIQISPGDVAAALQSNIPPRLIDVRTSKGGGWLESRARRSTRMSWRRR